MRGKVIDLDAGGFLAGITPAHAGKSDVVNYNIDLT